MLKKIIFTVVAALMALDLCAEESMEALTQRVFSLARAQYRLMDSGLDEGRCPKTMNQDGNLVTSDIRWWCSGFYPGSLWYIYENTGDEAFREMAQKRTLALAPLLEMKTDHDIGFMIGCSFGNALRLTADTTLYRSVLLKAADKLAGRFNPQVGAIRSWDFGSRHGWDFPVIIDNMMNLELLMDAYGINGREELKDVAVKHAYTTLNHHFRTDYSCYHVVDYDSTDGSVRRRQTHQGHDDESMWARGEAWAFYGFLMMYLKTGDEQFYMRADYIAKLLIRSLPEDGIPFWDFSCPGSYRDASAAAIMASAFIQMYEISGDRKFLDIACRQLRTLASSEYLAEVGTNGGFLLKHCVGNLPNNSEVDVPLSYADYYFLEALQRYSRAFSHPRLFADRKTFESIKQKVNDGTNSLLVKVHNVIMDEADNLPETPIVWALDDSGKRILGKSRTALRRLCDYSYAYRFTGDSVYLDKALRTLDQVCSMPDWNGWHFLDIAEMAAASGIAYDWLYDVLPPEMKTRIEETLMCHAFLEAYDFNKAWFYDRHHNWNQVCNGGLVIAALATREASGVIAGNVIRNAVRSGHRYISKIYAPDGCYAEGPSYWTYGNGYQVLLNGGLDSALGDDLGLSRMKGFDRAGDYIFNSYGAGLKFFNYSDNASTGRPSMPLWYFASRFDKPYLLANEVKMLDAGSYRDGNCSILALLTPYIAGIDPEKTNAGGIRMYAAEGDNPIVIFRGEGTSPESDWFLGIKGGKASNNHGHADSGSFVFDSFGQRWVSDPGSASYTKSENELRAKGGDFWKMHQESLRWTVYPLGNRWHSTLTAGGHLHNVDGRATVSDSFCNDSGCGATVNLTETLSADMESAVRTFLLDKDGVLTITDELKAKDRCSVTFTLATEAEVRLTDKGAILSAGGREKEISCKGAKCRWSLECPEEAVGTNMKYLRLDYSVPARKSTSISVTVR